MIPLKMLVNYPGFSGSSYLGAVRLFLNGSELGHLWFLPTLFLYFCVAFWLKKLLGQRTVFWILATGIALVLSQFRWGSSPYVIYVQYFFDFFWGFLLGAALACMKWKPVPVLYRLLAVCVSVIAAAVCIRLGNSRISLAASVLILLACYLAAPGTSNALVNRISNDSFGIYIFHSPLIYITFTCLLNASPLLVFAINFFGFGLVAIAVTELIEKTPARILIGQWK